MFYFQFHHIINQYFIILNYMIVIYYYYYYYYYLLAHMFKLFISKLVIIIIYIFIDFLVVKMIIPDYFQIIDLYLVHLVEVLNVIMSLIFYHLLPWYHHRVCIRRMSKLLLKIMLGMSNNFYFYLFIYYNVWNYELKYQLLFTDVAGIKFLNLLSLQEIKIVYYKFIDYIIIFIFIEGI